MTKRTTLHASRKRSTSTQHADGDRTHPHDVVGSTGRQPFSDSAECVAESVSSTRHAQINDGRSAGGQDVVAYGRLRHRAPECLKQCAAPRRQLVDCGALERQGDADFVIGLRLLEIASLAPPGHGLRQMALPFRDDLHIVTRQHVLLAIRNGGKAVLVEPLSAHGAGRVIYRVGGRMPLHATGDGLCLLANATPGRPGSGARWMSAAWALVLALGDRLGAVANRATGRLGNSISGVGLLGGNLLLRLTTTVDRCRRNGRTGAEALPNCPTPARPVTASQRREPQPR